MNLGIFYLQPLPHPSRRNCWEAIKTAPDGTVVQLLEETRSIEQNRLLWPLLALWAKTQTLVINGRETKAPAETWKTILLAGFRKETGRRPDYAIGLDGELVPLGYRTSTMGKREFAEFLTFVLAASLDRGLELPPRAEDEAQGYVRQYGRAA